MAASTPRAADVPGHDPRGLVGTGRDEPLHAVEMDVPRREGDVTARIPRYCARDELGDVVGALDVVRQPVGCEVVQA